MGRYIDWDDAVARYSIIGDREGAVDVNSTYIIYAEADIEGKLSSKFSTPFSSNNITVKDLCIDSVLLKALQFKDTKKAKLINDSIDARVKALLDGTAQMALEDGTTAGQDIQNAWSETQDYSPTFNVDNTLNAEVSSNRLLDIENARD